jgi:dTDP-4-dehydrorhamnose 3,5-epimerase
MPSHYGRLKALVMTNSLSGLSEVLLFKNEVFHDERGTFFESFQHNRISAQGLPEFNIAQINNSVSRAGTLRGVHFSVSASGQAKLITCTNGALVDLAIDLRKDSPDFLKFVTFELKSFDGQVIYIPSGFGHAFLALEDDTVINYGLSSPYDPKMEMTICPVDPLLSEIWGNSEKIISKRDREATSFDQALKEGIIGI